ncbi:MAG: hypothetical protein HC936_11900 [Leptolyngbyaceae cyanobacterium SU_3_3]|nr:hypothetical protein [Leptolyngbyaceae cyanobacterium SU_3_3]NJR52103.1 hypothetical protein [Leptolyngbyaceae cyanobacterium CSU_1_3]
MMRFIRGDRPSPFYPRAASQIPQGSSVPLYINDRTTKPPIARSHFPLCTSDRTSLFVPAIALLSYIHIARSSSSKARCFADTARVA